MGGTGTNANTDQQNLSTVGNFTDTAQSDIGGVVTSAPIRPDDIFKISGAHTHADIPPCHYVRVW